MQRSGAYLLTVLALGTGCVSACIWDADTLGDEKRAHPKLAQIILEPDAATPDPKPLRARIEQLTSNRRENDPAWWNDLAGAYLRLGEPAKASELLEPIKSRFPNDYGIHANLGTAYHLLNRYDDAEKEIARGLEINPHGHFGLEIYHLALLRYLSRDPEFRREHVYLEAWSPSLTDRPNSIYVRLYDEAALTNRFDAQFVSATNLLEGASYMASLNRRQPACWVMLGLLCLQHPRSELNLARAAFQRALDLGTPQGEFLKPRIAAINEHILKAKAHRTDSVRKFVGPMLLLVGVPLLFLGYSFWRNRQRRAKERESETI
jgi:tetratricopeptide (TPR) repeat protein